MGLRFRKSVKLAPGLRFNFSKTGISTTVGARGASVNIGKNGAFMNAGIPGTGIFMREKLHVKAKTIPTVVKHNPNSTSFKSFGAFIVLFFLGFLVANGAGIFYLPGLYFLYRAYRRNADAIKPVYEDQIQYVPDKRYKAGVRPEGTKVALIGYEPMSTIELQDSKKKARTRFIVAIIMITLGLWMQFGRF